MKRAFESELLLWRDSPRRMPLLVRGGRQVGKTFIIEKFGKEHFKSFTIINFEKERRSSKIFEESLDPKSIVRSIEEQTQQRLIPGESLLFFDEIQICPRAVMALRYFKEEMPQLHVIGAGSLLEFTLRGEDFSFPVGRIEFRYLYPLSFLEFLWALNEEISIERLQEISIKAAPSPILHEQLIRRVRDYFHVGGMPAAVQSFLETNSPVEWKRAQSSILNTYHSDFGKYGTSAQQKYLEIAFERVPILIGTHIKYNKISSEFQSRDLKLALHLLEKAGLIHPVHSCSASGLPLKATVNDKKFKAIFLDIGLVQEFLHTNPEELRSHNLTQINAGSLAEQFVGQELLAYSNSYCKNSLYFWEKEKRGSEAEVDYLYECDFHIFPIEVKAGKSKKQRSLRQFMEEKKAPFGIHISQNPLSFQENILSIPLYLIHKMDDLIKELMNTVRGTRKG